MKESGIETNGTIHGIADKVRKQLKKLSKIS